MVDWIKLPTDKDGLPPGTPVFIGGENLVPLSIDIIDYDRDHIESKHLDSSEDCLPFRDTNTVSWVHTVGLQDVGSIETLCNGFAIHPLTIEDILNTTQRPKTEIFDNYIYIVLQMLAVDEDGIGIKTEQISLILGEKFLLSFQEQEWDSFAGVRSRLFKNKGKIRKMGTDYLAYALIDAVVDHYFTVLEKIGEQIEIIDEELMDKPTQAIMENLHYMKREMIMLRRAVWPLRDVINSLLRDETELIKESSYVFIRDIYDHIVQVIDTVETFRDVVAGLLDLYLASISNKMNEVMKVLTIFAAIFIPLTFIAGIYGMNFNTEKSPYNMPELNWFWGYPFALLLMVAVSVGMVAFFKKKGWI